MKLDSESLDYIHDVAKTTKSLGIESLIIEPGCVRGTDENREKMILHTKDIVPLPFGSLGITRLDTFLSRFDLARSAQNMYVEYTTRGEDPTQPITKDNKDGMFAHTLQFKSKGLKLDFRPSNPMVIRAPRTLHDRAKYRLLVTDELVHFITKGKGALETNEFSIIIEDTGASIEMIDINNDKLTFQFNDIVEKVIEDDISPLSFNATFPINNVLPLFKNNIGTPFQLSEKGKFIEIVVNNLTSFILPKV